MARLIKTSVSLSETTYRKFKIRCAAEAIQISAKIEELIIKDFDRKIKALEPPKAPEEPKDEPAAPE